MQANPRSLDALFNSQLRYVVPMFQRLYAWKESHWETLWEDVSEKALLQLKGVKTNPHYLGALIIEGVRPTSPREVKRFLVIDGQQRITTLQLLLCAYRDVARKNEWKTLERPVSRYLENADPDVPRDMLHALRTLIPQHGMGFRHGEENSDAHIKASLVGPSVTVPFTDGKLLLGRWQGIFLCVVAVASCGKVRAD